MRINFLPAAFPSITEWRTMRSNPKNGKRLSFIDHCPGSCCKDRTNAPCAQRRLSNKTEKDTERGDRFGSRFDQSRWNSPKLQSLEAGCSDPGTSTSSSNATTQMCCVWKEPPNQQCLHLQHPVEHLPTAKVLKQGSEQRCSLGDDSPAALHQWTTEETRSAPAAHESSSPFCQAACWYAHAIWRKESLPWQILPAAWKRMIFGKMCYLLPVAYRYIEWPRNGAGVTHHPGTLDLIQAHMALSLKWMTKATNEGHGNGPGTKPRVFSWGVLYFSNHRFMCTSQVCPLSRHHTDIGFLHLFVLEEKSVHSALPLWVNLG